MHALKNLRTSVFAVDFGKTDQANTIAQCLCLRDIGSENFADTAHFDARKIDFRSET